MTTETETEVPFITKFQSGRQARSIKYVIRASRTIMDQATGFVTQTVPIRAEFKDHSFDIETAAKVYNWDIETQRMVSEYLQNHQDWHRVDGRGIFEDKRATQQPVTQEDELIAQAEATGQRVSLRCAFGEVAGGEFRQCPEEPEDGKQFCAAHSEYESAKV